jgi:hypothetical protein
MIEFNLKQLCWIGNGDKFHIKRRNQITTYCNGEIGMDIRVDAIAFTEIYDGLCKNCLHNYKQETKIMPNP